MYAARPSGGNAAICSRASSSVMTAYTCYRPIRAFVRSSGSSVGIGSPEIRAAAARSIRRCASGSSAVLQAMRRQHSRVSASSSRLSVSAAVFRARWYSRSKSPRSSASNAARISAGEAPANGGTVAAVGGHIATIAAITDHRHENTTGAGPTLTPRTLGVPLAGKTRRNGDHSCACNVPVSLSLLMSWYTDGPREHAQRIFAALPFRFMVVWPLEGEPATGHTRSRGVVRRCQGMGMLDESRRDDIGWLVATYDQLIDQPESEQRNHDLAVVQRWLCRVTGMSTISAATAAARRLAHHGVAFIAPAAPGASAKPVSASGPQRRPDGTGVVPPLNEETAAGLERLLAELDAFPCGRPLTVAEEARVDRVRRQIRELTGFKHVKSARSALRSYLARQRRFIPTKPYAEGRVRKEPRRWIRIVRGGAPGGGSRR